MTRTKTYALTLIATGIFALLCWAFADGLFNKNWWNRSDYTNSAIFTYVLMALILLAGIYQAARLPGRPVHSPAANPEEDHAQVDDPRFWKLLMGNVLVSILWLPLRFFVGREWLAAGEGKVRSSAWMDGGTALKGYWTNAVQVPPDGGHALITYDWYRRLLNYMLTHEWYTWFAKVIAIGELLVGIGLILGALVGIAAFFGTLMNFSYQLAGTASSNPVLFGLSVFLILAWKVAGYWGLDRWLLPALGAPWRAGSIFSGEGVHPSPGRTREPV